MILGLISYNGIAALGLFGGAITWVIQFFLKLQYSVLEREKLCRGLAVWDGKRCVEWKEGREEEGIRFWSSLGGATLGHSFWLIVIADGLFILNVAILVLLEQKRRRRLQTMGGLIGGQVTGAGGNTPQNIYSGGGMGGGPGSMIGTAKKHQLAGDIKPNGNGNLMLY